jgi:CBS domain-containing protein
MMDSGKSHEDLLQLYNEVDHFLRRQYRQDKYADHTFLIQELASKNRVIARNQQVMRAVAQIRNSLVHNPIPSVAQPISQPNPLLVKTYKAIRDSLMNPSTALGIAIPTNKIYTSTLDAKLSNVMKTMDENIFTHVPIIDNDKMIGIFSENTLLSYLVDSGETIITKDMKISELRKFLPLSAHRGEVFAFLPRSAFLPEVYEVFNKAIKVRKRVGMVFITEHGKENEKPLGIITAWDLASPESETVL